MAKQCTQWSSSGGGGASSSSPYLEPLVVQDFAQHVEEVEADVPRCHTRALASCRLLGFCGCARLPLPSLQPRSQPYILRLPGSASSACSAPDLLLPGKRQVATWKHVDHILLETRGPHILLETRGPHVLMETRGPHVLLETHRALPLTNFALGDNQLCLQYAWSIKSVHNPLG